MKPMMNRRHIILDPADNVTTLLDDEIEALSLENGGVVAIGVPFGHKAALKDIPAGGDVVKYGVTIGQALTPISTGEHVHVHNCK